MGDIEQAKQEIARLSEVLRRHQHLYYVEAMPEISDLEYDRLVDSLLFLESQYPDLRLPDSPSQRVGSDLGVGFPEVRHTIPVLSLDKAYTTDAVLQWMKRTRERGETHLSFTVEEKIDGVSLVLYYEKGLLARAVTRGNGSVGNDVTANAKTIQSIPLRLPKPLDVAVRGEVFLTTQDFESLNKEMETPYANPRNLAAGALRRLKSSETAKFPLRMFVYEAYLQSERSPDSHVGILHMLKDLGFMVNPSLGVFAEDELHAAAEAAVSHLASVRTGTYEDLPGHVARQMERRGTLAHEIDGLVIKVNELAVRELLGYTGHHPRWAVAFKFDAPEAQTTLLGIDVQVGRTGRITPVGRVKTVKVGNSMVSNVTLHNQDYINMLELAIGDTVAISKRGDVIPAIERVVEKNEEGHTTWTLPSDCPSCGTSLVIQGAHSFCPNDDCPDQVLGRIAFFVGREQMDIEGFGPETVAFLVGRNLVRDIPDIYEVDYDGLVGEPGFGTKKAGSLGQAVSKSKDRPYASLLVALGIPDFGKKAVDLLLKAGIRSMEQLLALVDSQDMEPLLAIKGFGQRTVESLFEYLSRPAHRQMIERLGLLGLHMRAEKAEDEQILPQIFVDQVWCVTGSFEHFAPRSLALQEIEARGGRTTGSVTRKTTHLLAGSGAGSKLQQAASFGTKIVDETDFIAMLEGGPDGTD
ncbi:MAG: NAD-dependent DNA ligase LigA [Sphaerochaetaceae bacterium]|jgi:DNA ligase (NAD+)|nr:NAD-dependent DNA ligase LigA [Sphaerochaetaceae bacterium]MDX9939523.1 NAD-dependent DNA ligase LigA [Sphaerochaetaceae bacterium]